MSWVLVMIPVSSPKVSHDTISSSDSWIREPDLLQNYLSSLVLPLASPPPPEVIGIIGKPAPHCAVPPYNNQNISCQTFGSVDFLTTGNALWLSLVRMSTTDFTDSTSHSVVTGWLITCLKINSQSQINSIIHEALLNYLAEKFDVISNGSHPRNGTPLMWMCVS